MSTYTYLIDQFPNDKYDSGKLATEINDSSITVSLSHLSGTETDVDIVFRASLDSEDHTTLSGIVAIHDGEPESIPQVMDVNLISSEEQLHVNTHITGVPYDRSGKIRFHQTSRKLGLRIMWTGVGDDSSDVSKVGGGTMMAHVHKIGDTEPMTKYIDFNVVENETWMHEGYLTWKSAELDTLSLQLVPRIATVSGVVGGDKTLYGGYMVVPTPPGYGNIEVVSDLSHPNGGLIYMPNNDLDEAPVAFWDADYNPSTHLYENIRPNYTGTGRYNIFSYEVIFAEFIRQIPLLNNGFIPLNSSDTDQLGHGMRLKIIADTNNDVDDHDWAVACIMCLHRESSI